MVCVSRGGEQIGLMTHIGVSGCSSRMISIMPIAAAWKTRRFISPQTLMPRHRLMKSAGSDRIMRADIASSLH